MKTKKEKVLARGWVGVDKEGKPPERFCVSVKVYQTKQGAKGFWDSPNDKVVRVKVVEEND